MRFGIDLDGVLANFTENVVDIANRLWPGKLPRGFVPRDWNYTGDLTSEEMSAIFKEIAVTPYFWENESELSGTEDLADYLRNERYRHNLSSDVASPENQEKRDQIYFVTARMATVGNPPLVQSAHWLAGRGFWPRNGFSTVIPVEHAKHKKDLFRGLGLNFMLDDYAPTVRELNGIEGMHAFVLDQPWNQKENQDLPRVFSVAEYLDEVNRLSSSAQ